MDKHHQTNEHFTKLSLKELFNQTASNAATEFPHEIGNLYLSSPSAGQIYTSPTAVQLMADNQKETEAGIKSAVDYVRNQGVTGLARTVSVKKRTSLFTAKKHDFNIIVMNMDETFLNQNIGPHAAGNFSSTVHMINILDHELGHHVTPGGKGERNPNMMESAADAYGALRHVQRFGKNTDFFEHAIAKRTLLLVHNDSPLHFTSPVMQKIEKLRHEIDIESLTPKETANLAGRLARTHHMEIGALSMVAAAFKPMRMWLQQSGIGKADINKINPKDNVGYFQTLIAIMKAHKNIPDVYRAGKIVIEKHMPEIMKESANNDFWRAALSFMETHEKNSGIILNFGEARDAMHRNPAKTMPSPRM